MAIYTKTNAGWSEIGANKNGSPAWIDADNPDNLVGLPTSGRPLGFYGSGRPDAAGLNLSAPRGSTFTCTDPTAVEEVIAELQAQIDALRK